MGKGHKLIVGATSASYDGQMVMPTLGSALNNELVTGNFDNVGSTMQEGREGKALKIIHLTLPLDVKVQINRWTEASEGNYINAKITMSAQPSQDGHCGTFNGNPVDDDRMQVRARLGAQGVPAGMLLFPGGKTPIAPGNRPDVNNCPDEKLKLAKKACDDAGATNMECLIDNCFGGGAVR